MDLLFYPSTTCYPNSVDYAHLTDELLLRDLWLTVPDYYEKKRVRKRLVEVRNEKVKHKANQKRPGTSKGNGNSEPVTPKEVPRYRISRTGSFEEKLRRARMEASHPIEVPVNSTMAPDPLMTKKQFSSSVDTDDGQPPDFSFDSGNASGSDSDNQRKTISSSDALTSDEGTSSEDEKIIKEYFEEDKVAKLDDTGFASEVLFPGSEKRITKVTAIKEDSATPITIQVETRPPTDVGRTVFELLSTNHNGHPKTSVPNSSSLVTNLVKRSNGSPIIRRPNSGLFSYHFENEEEHIRSEFPEPEEINNVDVLEEMLMDETEYEKRRKIRSRIRQLKRERGDTDEGVESPKCSPRHVKYAQISYIIDDGHEVKPVPQLNVQVQRIVSDNKDQNSAKHLSNGSPYKANIWDSSPRLIRNRRKFVNMDDEEYVNLDEITDEDELNELLEDTDDIDERKKIRTRLLEVKAEKRAKRESKLKKREDDREAALKQKVRAAEEQKQRTMAMYDEAAKSAPAGGNKSFNVDTYAPQGGSARSTPSRYTGEPKKDLVEDAIRNRRNEAENRKKRMLAAYDHASKSGPAGAHKEVNFEAFKRADVSEFQPKPLQAGSSTFGMSGGVPDHKGPMKANLVNLQISNEAPELDATEKAIRARVQEAEEHKKKLLAAYDMAAKEGGGPKHVILSNYLQEVQVPADNKVGVNHSSTGCFSGGIPLYNRPQDPLPASPRDRFKKMDAKVANTPGSITNTKPNFTVNKRTGVSGIKDAILNWCQCKTKEYENINITNFSSSWANGLAFCALTHHFYPDAFDYYSLMPENRRQNFDIAFKAAEDYGGVCPLLETDDMIMMKNKPDWKCVFTYVQSLYQKYRTLE